MKTKLVLWGWKKSEVDEKAIFAFELNPVVNCVNIWIFEGEEAKEELFEQLMHQWKRAEAIAFPENHVHMNMELTASPIQLPEMYSLGDKDDILKRTHNEWLFILLSTKLFKTYENELNDLQETIEGLTKYDKNKWEELKGFQNKITAQTQEQNLFKEHAQILRTRMNDIFEILKELRTKENEAFESATQEAAQKIEESIVELETALEAEKGDWNKIFNKLKNIQNTLKTTTLTKQARNDFWARIDSGFKKLREKKNNHQTENAQAIETRLQKRIEGLSAAIKKMDDSVKRDEKELDFQNKKINGPNPSQLETQLREVKAQMVMDRMASKKVKLADMNKTLQDLESRLKRIISKMATAEDLKAAEAMSEEEMKSEEIDSVSED